MTAGDAIRIALSWLATYGLHSTLLLGGAWLLCRLRPPRLDRNRERVWKLALIGGVLSATLQLALGAHPPFGSFELDALTRARAASSLAAAPAVDPSPVLPTHRAPAQTRRASAPRSGPDAERVELVRRPALPAEAVHPQPDVEPPAARPPALHDEPTDTRADSPASTLAARLASESRGESPASSAGEIRSSSPTWAIRPGHVLALWSGLGLLGLLGLAASWAGLRRRMLGRELLREGPLVERFARLCERARVRRRVRLSVSARIATPFSTGLLRPEVCLPRAVLSDLSAAQQEALLAHELAHLVRRDPAWFGAGFVIEKLFFFQPLNRVARRQLAELAEMSCDDWAVRWTGARLALASCLTEVAGWVLSERPRLVAPPGLAGHRSRLGRRVERLLDDRRSPSGEPPAPWWPPLAGGVLGLVALAAPGVSAVAPARALPTPLPAPRPEELPSAAAARTPQPTETPRASSAVAVPSIEVGANPAATTTTPELAQQRAELEAELALLEGELAALRAELEARALRERFQDALARIDERMQELRDRHRRASELLALLGAIESGDGADARGPSLAPATDPAPGPDEHDEHLEGESR